MLENLSLIAYGIAVIALLFTFGHGVASRRHWRARRHGRALHRGLWMLVSLLLALLGGVLGTALIGYQRMNGEVPVAALTARQVASAGFRAASGFPRR